MPAEQDKEKAIKNISEMLDKLSDIQKGLSKQLTNIAAGGQTDANDLKITFSEIENLDKIARHERDVTH